MATHYEIPLVSDGAVQAVRKLGTTVIGVAIMVISLAIAVALLFYDPGDPSWNQATARAVTNPLGMRGAVLSDLLFQGFGLAAWLVPAAVGAFGLRLALGLPHPRPIVPLTALPLALMAVPAALADRDGLVALLDHGLPGGLVGYELWTWFQRYAKEPRAKPTLFLGWGEQDPLDVPNSLVADVLPADRWLTRPGGHKWTVWKPLFAELAARALTP